MNNYQITVNGIEYQIEIDDPNASTVRVRVNGQPFQVTVQKHAPPAASSPTAPADEPEFSMDAYVPAVTVTYQDVEIEEPDNAAESQAQTAEGAISVSAPMPGTILDISVKVGDQVGEGDTLCNLEAMKMKSPIRAPGSGTVAQVLIAEGQNVGYGETLFTLN